MSGTKHGTVRHKPPFLTVTLLRKMDFRSLSMVHDHLDCVASETGGWTQDGLEGDDNLRVACEGLRTKCQAMCDILDGILGGNKDDGDTDGERSDEGSDEDRLENMLSKVHHKANERTNMVLEAEGGDKILVAEFLMCMATKVTNSQCKQEDLAFIKLHRGYSATDISEWCTALQSYTMEVETYQALIDISCRFQAEELNVHLQARDQYLTTAHQTVGGYCFVHGFLKQIEAIRFTSDWKKKAQEPGGKKYKTNFAWMVYQSRTGIVPPDPRMSSREALKAFKVFKKAQHRSITRRNYLLDMYHEYGAAVLLDPTWDIDCPSHGTKAFPHVLKMLRSAKPASLSSLQTANNDVLMTVIQVLGRHSSSQQLVRLQNDIL